MLFKKHSLRRGGWLATCMLAGATTWFACSKHDLLNAEIQADPQYGVALGSFSFLFSDFIKSDSLISVGRDSSIAIRYAKDSLAAYTLTDIVNRATGGLGGSSAKDIVIGAVSIPDIAANQNIILSEFGNGFPVGSVQRTLFTTGGTVPPAPAPSVPAFTAPEVRGNLADQTEFETITLASGSLSIAVTNNFPFAITDLNVELLNRATNTVLVTIPIGNIPAGGTTTGTAALANKTLIAQMAYRVPSFGCPGIANGVTVSPSSTLGIAVAGTNLKLKTGRVKISAQTLPQDTILSSIQTNNVAQKIREVTIRSARLDLTLTKSTPVNFTVSLTFPTMRENNIPVTRTITVNQNSVSTSITLNNAIMDLSTIATQPYNQLPINVSVSVMSSGGQLVNMNETDKVNVQSVFSNLQISGAKGQFGTFEMDVAANTQNFGADFDYLSSQSLRLLFDNPQLRIKYENSFGIPVSADLDIKSKGILQGEEALGLPANNGKVSFALSYPKIDVIGRTEQLVKDSFVVIKQNSNLVNFLGILPKTITSSGKVYVNSPPAARPTEINYFTADSRIKLGMEMDIPLKFSAKSLMVRDTTDAFKKLNLKDDQLTNIDTVGLDFQYNTLFPLSTSIDLAGLTGGTSTDILTGIVLPAADVMDANGRVTSAKTGRFEVKVTNEQFKQMVKADNIVIRAEIKTAGTGLTPVALYTHYSFSLGLGCRVRMKIVK